MNAFAFEYPTYYEVIVTDGTNDNSYTYQYTKDQDIEVSIREAKMLAEELVSMKQFIPTPI